MSLQCGNAVDGAVNVYVDAMHRALANAAASSVKSSGDSTQSAQLSTARHSTTYAAESTIVEEEELQVAHAAASKISLAFFQTHAVQDADKTPPFEVILHSILYIQFND